MLFSPEVNITEKWNRLSAHYELLERQHVFLTSLVYRYQSEINGSIEVAVEIAKSQLALLQEYTQCSVDQQKEDWFKKKIVKCKKDLEEQYHQVVRDTLSRRKGLPDGRRIKTLTPEMKEGLCSQFSKKISEQIEKGFKDFDLNERIDLLELQKKLEEKIKNKTKVLFQLFDEKEEVQIVKEDVLAFLDDLKKEKEELRDTLTQITDIFYAAQAGDIDWLKNQLAQTADKKTLVTQKKQDSESQFSVLHTAAHFNRDKFVRLLLENGASANVIDAYRDIHLFTLLPNRELWAQHKFYWISKGM